MWKWISELAKTTGVAGEGRWRVRTYRLVLVQLELFGVVTLQRIWVRRLFGYVGPFEGSQRPERWFRLYYLCLCLLSAWLCAL